MNVPSIVAGIALIGGLALLRHWAARRVIRGDGRYLWLMFVPMLVAIAVIIWASVSIVSTNLPLAIVMLVGSGLFALLFVKSIRGMSRSISAASSPDEIQNALFDGMATYLPALMAFGLVVAIVAGVGLVIYYALAR